MAVGGSVPNIYNAGEVTALNSGDTKMYVDYVRVYQQSDAKDYTTDGSTSTRPYASRDRRHCRDQVGRLWFRLL